MFKKMFWLIAVGLFMGQQARADFMVAVSQISPSNTFAVDSGIRSIAVDITGAGTGHTTNYLIANFSIQGPALFTATPGTFGQISQVGNGNLNLSSTFTTISAGAGATLSLDFNLAANSITNGQLATLSFDTTGLALGDYLVGVTFVDADGTGFTSSNGGFSISAVPEPSSMVLMGLSVAGFGAFARFRKGKKKAVAA